MRKLTNRLGVAVMGAVIGLAVLLPVGMASGATTAVGCESGWGSAQKQDGVVSATTAITDVRAGQHDCYDRLVVDGATWVDVSYVDQVRQDGSGKVVPLRGGARLQILTNRADDVTTGNATYRPANPSELVDVAGWQTFRQVAFAGSFEGRATLGLGVRARLPFRVMIVTSSTQPPRAVIDVARTW